MSSGLADTLLLMFAGAVVVLALGGCTSRSQPPSAPHVPPQATTVIPPEVEYDPATAAEQYRKTSRRP
jgi:hypothetical protein